MGHSKPPESQDKQHQEAMQYRKELKDPDCTISTA